MRTLTLLLSGLCLSSSATAQDIGGTLSFEMSNLHNGDASWDLYSGRDGMPGRGLRGGLRFGDNLSLEASWQRVRRGATVSAGGGDGGYGSYYSYDYYNTGSDLSPGEFRTAWFSDQFAVGPRLTHGIARVIYPYVGVEGVLMRGVIKIDDDPSSKSNAGQISAGGAGLGAIAFGGIELRTPSDGSVPQLAIYLDGGYAMMQTLNFGDYGDIQPGGFILRGGIGVRF